MSYKRLALASLIVVVLICSAILVWPKTVNAAGCNATVQSPYQNSGSNLISAAASVTCGSLGWHTMQVCLMRDRFGSDVIKCNSGDGTFTYRYRSVPACNGAGVYYTRLTLDGVNSYSSRVYRNC